MTIYIIAVLECDRCHCVNDDIHAYHETQAQRWADENGWKTIGDNHICKTCKTEITIDELEKGQTE